MDDALEAARLRLQLVDSLAWRHLHGFDNLIPRNHALESILEQQRRFKELVATADYGRSVAAVMEAEMTRRQVLVPPDSSTAEQLRGIEADLTRTLDQVGVSELLRLKSVAADYYAQIVKSAGLSVLDDLKTHMASIAAIISAAACDPAISEIAETIIGVRLTLAEHLAGLRDVFPGSVSERIQSAVMRSTRLFEGYSARVLPTLLELPGTNALSVRGRVTTSSRGVRASADVVEHIQLDTDDSTTCEPDAAVLSLLQELDDALVEQYLGAIETFNRRGRDSARQVAISLRELLKFVIEGLAPTATVVAWLTARGGAQPHSQPTDRDRLRYIWQGRRRDEMVFVSSQIGTITAFRTALNEPTHGKRFNATAMRAYIRGLESAILLILESRQNL